jgi:pimeloyl-ACP methyl ester carboxylesterase
VKTAKKFHNLTQPQTLDQVYTSKVFLLKYAEEIVKFCETVVFRTELDPTCEESPQMTLLVELMFTDINGDLAPDSVTSFLSFQPNFSLFQKVSEVTYSLTPQMIGFNQMLFITFLDSFSSSLSATIHFYPTNYKVQGDYTELIFPELTQNLTAERIDKAYDFYLLPLGIAFNRLLALLGLGTEEPLALPLVRKSENEADFIFKTLNRVLFSRCVESRNRYEVAQEIFIEIQEVAAKIMRLKHEFLTCLKEKPDMIVQKLMKEFITLMDDRWGENIIRELKNGEIEKSDLKSADDLETAKKLKASGSFVNMNYFQVIDNKVFSTAENNTILFETCYFKAGQEVPNPQVISSPVHRSRHLIILVHGYLGSSIDVKMLQDTISNIFPKGLFLLSRCNEGKTDGSILEMGGRLAEEVKEFIRSYSSIHIDRISFIGHSLGGLIIRAALPRLSSIKERFYSYLSLACPHLGCANNESFLIDAGMWVLCKIKQSTVLMQLALKDEKDVKQSTIFRLAKADGLGWFVKVLFFSSSQDSYVPFYSARAEVPVGAAQDSVEFQMVDALLRSIHGSFHRINTIFNINSMEVGNLIGRSAHVMFLDNLQFLNILVFKYLL